MENKTTKQNGVGGRLLKSKEWGVISPLGVHHGPQWYNIV